MILIPHDRLSRETLDALLESYINREGTDYGEVEMNLEQKVERLRKQVEAGDVLIVYDVESDSCNLVPKGEFPAKP